MVWLYTWFARIQSLLNQTFFLVSISLLGWPRNRECLSFSLKGRLAIALPLGQSICFAAFHLNSLGGGFALAGTILKLSLDVPCLVPHLLFLLCRFLIIQGSTVLPILLLCSVLMMSSERSISLICFGSV